MTQDRPVMFRAGRRPGEQPLAPHELAAHPMLSIPGVVLAADVSEFQPSIDASYLRWSPAIIMRVAYGARHDDRAWYNGARRDFLHGNGVRYLGMYQYVTAFEDVTAQAREFCRLIGSMRQGEDLYADIEEGSGNLQHTWGTWANVVNGELGWAPRDYSGLYFARDHNLAPVDWVAAYGMTEPSVPHLWWQFTDRYAVPGIGTADCSVFHGSIDQLAALAYQPARPASTEDTMIVLDNLQNGGQAIVLPVPPGKTKIRIYADPGYRGPVQPELRVIFNVGAARKVLPTWDTPVALDVPAGGARLSLARLDAGDVPVTVDFT